MNILEAEKRQTEQNEFGSGSTKLLQRTPSGGEVLTLQQDIDLDNGQQKVSVSVKTSRTPSDAQLYHKTTKVLLWERIAQNFIKMAAK